MTNKPLSPRAQKALQVLENGGQFREMLERNSYTGRDQFRMRLMDGKGGVVRGIGHATFHELRSMLRTLRGGTTVSTYYGLHTDRRVAA